MSDGPDSRHRYPPLCLQQLTPRPLIAPFSHPPRNKNLAAGPLRLPTKPLERRSLINPCSTVPLGYLHCWLDILSHADAAVFPPDDVSLPPADWFEVCCAHGRGGGPPIMWVGAG